MSWTGLLVLLMRRIGEWRVGLEALDLADDVLLMLIHRSPGVATPTRVSQQNCKPSRLI